jgi:Acetyltransferase (GNAT) family.
MTITFAQETGVTAEEYIACVGQTTLGASRPLANAERVQAMLDESDLVVTARTSDGTLLGLARTITDWHWVAYCMDLAVVETQQGSGIGKALLDETARILGPGVGIALLPLPGVEGFYRHIGMADHPAFWRKREG